MWGANARTLVRLLALAKPPNGNVTHKGVNAVGLCKLERSCSTITLLIRPQRYVELEVDACTSR